MARIPERKFDPSRPVFARKYFIANGHRYEPGMRFPWASTGVSQRRAMQMFEAGKLTHDDKMAVEDTLTELVEMGEEWDAAPADVDDETILAAATGDDLDAIDDMKELRAIADQIGASYKVSKADQRQAIRDHRNKETD